MSESIHDDVLDILDFDFKKKDMIVLGALLKSQDDLAAFVDFETIREQLAIDEGGRRGKDPLIYRSLSWLENAGLLRVDRSEHKHGYNSNVTLIHSAVTKAIDEKIKQLRHEISKVKNQKKNLDNLDLKALTSEFLFHISGHEKIERPIFADGWENVLQLLDDKIYSSVKKGDVVRFSLEWLTRVDVITDRRIQTIRKLLKAGVKFRGLEHNKIEKEHLQAFYKLALGLREEGFELGFRICERKDSTYQIVGRGKEGIVLVTSENPMTATWIPRSSNTDLVDNAIQTFDEDFEKGIDIEQWGRS